MTHPAPPPLSTREIPGQRASLDHPAHGGQAPPPRLDSSAAPITAARESYAPWHYRVAAAIIDALLQIPFVVAQVIGLLIAYDGGGITRIEHAGLGIWNDSFQVSVPQMTTDTWIGLAIANVAGLALSIFTVRNNIVRQGRRGASIGKACMNLMVVSERDGRPIGSLMTVVRNWVHVIDLVTFGIGYLWPLWDRKRQTFADMITGTAVLHLPPLPRPQVPAQMTPTYRS
jgi:uncharacterized RDD family membrane protein YckC